MSAVWTNISFTSLLFKMQDMVHQLLTHVHAQLQVVQPLVQLLVCQSLSPLCGVLLYGSVGGLCS